MKYVLTLAAALVASVAGSTFAGEGQVSEAQLAALGVPGIQVMSDAQGGEVRGQGFAFATSTSVANLPGTSSDPNTATALNFNNAAVATGAASAGSIDILLFGDENVFGGFLVSIQVQAAVASQGYAIASSN